MKPAPFKIWRSVIFLLIGSIALANGFKKKDASLAMLLCVFPGCGQYYTERYVTGIVISGSELAIGYYAYKYHKEEEYEKRNSMLWWGLFIFGYSLADAYVGAKMYGFDIEADIDKVSLSYTFKW